MNSTLTRLFLLMILWPTLMRGADVVLPKDATAQEREFVSSITNFITTSNVDALLVLDYLDKSHESLRGYERKFYQDLVAGGCLKISLERVDPAISTERIDGNDKIRESLPVRWILRVAGRPPPSFPAGATMETMMRIGLLDGKMRITTSVAVGG